MSDKFKPGDKVVLMDWASYPGLASTWNSSCPGLLGLHAILVSKNGVMNDEQFWTATVNGERIGWPEVGMRLVEEERITQRSMKAVKSEPPQWMVSRTATLNENECQKCGAPLPCGMHSDPAEHLAASMGMGIAAAHRAGWKP